MSFLDMAPSRRCRAHSSRTGEPCKKWAMKGQFVCRKHGGASPQAKKKAEDRLREMVDPMISRLHELAMQTDNLKVASDCVRDALDRAGIGEMAQAKVRQSHHSDKPSNGVVVNIGFLQVQSPQTTPTLESETIDALPAGDEP